MAVLEDRAGVVLRGDIVVERLTAFERAPSEVAAAAGVDAFGRRGHVDLLDAALTDVGDPQVAGLGIEAVAPRVAQADRPDLAAGTLGADEGVVGRDRVAEISRRCGRVDPQHLAEHFGQVQGPSLRITPGAAVTKADIEHPVRAECEVPAIVVGVRLLDDQHGAQALPVESTGGVDGELDDVGVAVVVGEVDVRLRAVRMERQAEQSLLATGSREVADVEHDRRAGAALDTGDRAILSGDVEAGVAVPPREVDGCGHLGDRSQGHLGWCFGSSRWAGRCRTADGEGDRRGSDDEARCAVRGQTHHVLLVDVLLTWFWSADTDQALLDDADGEPAVGREDRPASQSSR